MHLNEQNTSLISNIKYEMCDIKYKRENTSH